MVLRKRVQAGRLIMSTIGTEVLIELGYTLVQRTPDTMRTMLEENFAADFTADEQDRLMRRAQQTRIRRCESFGAYFTGRKEVRQQMIRYKHPGIERETYT